MRLFASVHLLAMPGNPGRHEVDSQGPPPHEVHMYAGMRSFRKHATLPAVVLPGHVISVKVSSFNTQG